MPGDEQVRHCGQCRQNVYNVASLTRAEAMRLVRRARLPAHLPPPRQHRDHVGLPRAAARGAQERAADLRGHAAGRAVGADLRAVRRPDGAQAPAIGGGATMGAPVPSGQVVAPTAGHGCAAGAAADADAGRASAASAAEHAAEASGRSGSLRPGPWAVPGTMPADGAVKGKIAIRGLEDSTQATGPRTIPSPVAPSCAWMARVEMDDDAPARNPRRSLLLRRSAVRGDA